MKLTCDECGEKLDMSLALEGWEGYLGHMRKDKSGVCNKADFTTEMGLKTRRERFREEMEFNSGPGSEEKNAAIKMVRERKDKRG